MATHLPDVVDHELSERRKSAIYFALIAATTIFVALALVIALFH
jgi:hypothetical protein